MKKGTIKRDEEQYYKGELLAKTTANGPRHCQYLCQRGEIGGLTGCTYFSFFTQNNICLGFSESEYSRSRPKILVLTYSGPACPDVGHFGNIMNTTLAPDKSDYQKQKDTVEAMRVEMENAAPDVLAKIQKKVKSTAMQRLRFKKL